MLSRLTNFFSIFFFVFHTNPYKIERIRIFGCCLPVVSLLFILLLAIYNVELRFVPLSFPCTSICSVHSGAFVAYSGTSVFSLVPVYSGTILVHSVSFRRHSGSFQYIPIPFLSIPFHSGVILPRSGLFRLIPVYSVPFLCLVTPGLTSLSRQK